MVLIVDRMVENVVLLFMSVCIELFLRNGMLLSCVSVSMVVWLSVLVVGLLVVLLVCYGECGVCVCNIFSLWCWVLM